jgi:hypothetical protein
MLGFIPLFGIAFGGWLVYDKWFRDSTLREKLDVYEEKDAQRQKDLLDQVQLKELWHKNSQWIIIGVVAMIVIMMLRRKS